MSLPAEVNFDETNTVRLIGFVLHHTLRNLANKNRCARRLGRVK
jgi:hypothetical protein